MIYSLYQYTNKENGKKYIGVTHDPVQRHQDHAKGKSGARVFNRAVCQSGIEAFDFRVLALFDRADVACYHEQAAILKFDTLAPHGYNLCAGAPFTQYHGPCSEETKEKLSKALMGRVFSADHKRKISEAKINPSDETRRKLSNARRGHQSTEETRRKISQAQRGRLFSEETRKKLSESLKRRPPFSAETRRKMSNSQKGKHYGKLSDEHKQAISKALRGRHLSLECRIRLSKACMGRVGWNKGKKLGPLSMKTRAAMTRGQIKHWKEFPKKLGYKLSEEHKLHIGLAGKGRVFSDEHKRKIGEGIHRFYMTHEPQTKRRKKVA